MVDRCHALEEFAYLLVLPPKLFPVGKMLVLAAATGGEERTTWLLTTGTGNQNLQQVSV